MNKTIIRRYFSEDTYEAIKNDFRFLIEKIIRSGFEYDLQIRNNYFNLYYKGSSLGKVSYNKNLKQYRIEIHTKFINDKIRNGFKSEQSGNYWIFKLPPSQLHPLFSSRNLASMSQKVKEVNFQEEISFEQMLMTDNLNRKDLIIVDRQIVDTTDRTKMDLLALKQKKNHDYSFCIIEVKLGNNPELKEYVIGQLNSYIQRISRNFEQYKKCYELNLKQKQGLELVDRNLEINIVPGVIGIVVVGGYSGIAEKSIKELKSKSPSIKVIHLKNVIDFSKIV